MSTQIIITLNDRTAEQALEDAALAFGWQETMTRTDDHIYTGTLDINSAPPFDTLKSDGIADVVFAEIKNGQLHYKVETEYTIPIQQYGMQVWSDAVNRQVLDTEIKANGIRAQKAVDATQIADVSIVTA